MLLDALSHKLDVSGECDISRDLLVYKLEGISVQPHIRTATAHAVCGGFSVVAARAPLGRKTDVFMAVEHPEFGGESLAATPDESDRA
jgi:hypothetical protein